MIYFNEPVIEPITYPWGICFKMVVKTINLFDAHYVTIRSTLSVMKLMLKHIPN